VPNLDDLLEKVARRLTVRPRRLPEATYRLQFHAGFTFRDALALVPYLADLGISHCYASPYLKARPGSLHGYDIVDHNTLNPEVGTPEEHDAFVAALHEHGLGLILDTVPNHMGVLGNENAWWNDVLENGPASPYAAFFDIAWRGALRPELQDKVLLPVLGSSYGEVLESGQLQVRHEAGVLTLHYFDHRFPLSPCSYGLVLAPVLEELRQTLAPDDPDLLEAESIATALTHLPGRAETDPARLAERQREKEVVKRRLSALIERFPEAQIALDQALLALNGTPGDPSSFDALERLLDDQAYRLAFWRVASDEINYRRFFDVNELAALSMEREEVFRATHAFMLELVRRGLVDGLRIDHPDGLYDPRQYLQRLQQQLALAVARDIFEVDPAWAGHAWADIEAPLTEALVRAAVGSDDRLRRPLYLVVEKILGLREHLPPDWPVYGSSGYKFLNQVNGLFVDGSNAASFTRLYQELTGILTSFPDLVYQKKYLILQAALSSELMMLAAQLDRLAASQRRSRDFTFHSLHHALREVIACFPVYRSYTSDEGVRDVDRKIILGAIKKARAGNPELSPALFTFVRDTLLLDGPGSDQPAIQAARRRFAGKFQQVTAPVTAKGVEDTAFYIWNRLLALNEVGGAPDRFGLSPNLLHTYFADRQARWPWAMSATSTHDTKRSEDVRARLDVLSELPDEWRQGVVRWSALNAVHKVTTEEEVLAPDTNEEYAFYQTVLGAWPLEPVKPEEYTAFVGRVQEYLTKALHEAKVHSSWINPDAAYDEAVKQFAARVLDPKASAAFHADCRPLRQRISHYGLLNGLGQVLLKLTAPGVPDIYQGSELWDFSLVDPDNRRPVDYTLRRRLLAELRERAAGPDLAALIRELLEHKQDGRVKLYVTTRGLHCRRDHPGLFTTGDYLPLSVAGSAQTHAFGFARQHEGTTAVVVVPRLLTTLCPDPPALPLGKVWGDTRLTLPDGMAGRTWRNVFTGETVQSRDGTLALAEVLATFPVALWLGED
jgi:(1->4)-alpha-D-glucan 1-alpha-D-glucosylmutase